MLTALMVLLRSFRLICGGHGATVLENLALRQQLAVLTRTVKRPQVRSTDRLFWILLAKDWRDWCSALIIVQPDTVVRWHRQWLRRRWTRRSKPQPDGRPPIDFGVALLSGSFIEQLAPAPAVCGPQHLPRRILMKQDQMSMAASIESRVPFLDHVLVEFASQLPDSMKLADSPPSACCAKQ
jgi:hypothetical protein